MPEISNDAPAGKFPPGINERASVVGASEIEIAAPPEAVWDVLTAFDCWPSWNPDVKSMSVQGGLAEGSVFRWKAGPGTITSTMFRRSIQKALDRGLEDWLRYLKAEAERRTSL